MAHTYTAIIQQRGEWWVGRIPRSPQCELPRKNARRIAGYAENHTRRNARNQPRGSHQPRRKWLSGSRHPNMKRRTLIKHLKNHGCFLIREG